MQNLPMPLSKHFLPRQTDRRPLGKWLSLYSIVFIWALIASHQVEASSKVASNGQRLPPLVQATQVEQTFPPGSSDVAAPDHHPTQGAPTGSAHSERKPWFLKSAIIGNSPFHLATHGVFLIALLSVTLGALVLRRRSLLESRTLRSENMELRQALESSAKTASHYQVLVESAADMVFTLDHNGHVLFANLQTLRLLADGDSGLITHRAVSDFLNQDQTKAHSRYLQEVLRTGNPVQLACQFLIQDRYSWFHVHYVLLQSEDTHPATILGIARDITELRQSANRRAATEKLASLGTMASGVAHEINNPLSIMLGFCDLLLEKIPAGTMEHNDLKTIERHGLHCKAIMESLLHFSRLRGERNTFSNLHDNLRETLSTMYHAMDLHHIETALDLADEDLVTRGDPASIQQALTNVITNAVQAMPDGGKLGISSRHDPEQRQAVLTISDTGQGIPAQFREKVFDPFFTCKKVGKGIGLGLSVSYGLIVKYGGTITLASVTEEEGLGVSGTTVTISFPLHQPSKGSPSSEAIKDKVSP